MVGLLGGGGRIDNLQPPQRGRLGACRFRLSQLYVPFVDGSGARNIVDPSAELTWCGSIATRERDSLQLNRHVFGLAGDQALPFILGNAPHADGAAVLAQGERPSILDGSWKPPMVNRNLR